MGGEPIRKPALVAHADWSTNPRKRWHSVAMLNDDGCYQASAPARVGPVGTYFRRLRQRAGSDGTVLTGFDFPIGWVTDFRSLLLRLGRDQWIDFYEPARSRSEISISRPFYPGRPGRKGEHSQEHLYATLGFSSMSALKRRCERSSRAEAMFWLVGSKQVGRSAISGWKDLLTPALASQAQLSIWPFDGRLHDLLKQPGIVVSETYPAAMYRHLRLGISKGSKRRQSDRAADASTIQAWARTSGVRLTKPLQDEIEDGFGPHKDGEDPFDAVVGVLGMLDVVLGNLDSGEPQDERTQIEGWMLGYSDASSSPWP